MPDTVIVTVRCGKFSGDFELPAQLPLKDWETALLEAAQAQFSLCLRPGSKLRLAAGQTTIQSHWTLEQCGIYDGSILNLTIV